MREERKAGTEAPRTVLVFKHEDEVDGEPIGPATVFTDTRADRSQAQVETIPFVPPCVCETREGSPGERCGRCGGEIREPWVTLTQAKARARELGLGLVET